MIMDDLAVILQPATKDMKAVDTHIHERLKSRIPAISELAAHIISSGGKRLRPTMVILAAKASGYTGDDHIKLAVIIEFVHTATLLHDDVVDESLKRRGEPTANSIWGNNLSVLVGDFLYSRAFEMMVEVGHMRVMELLARATNVIAEGEVQQSLNRGNPDIPETEYIEVITHKTARLFSAAAELGAVAAQLDDEKREAISSYGLHLGIAYQLLDDLLDYRGEAALIGKNLGDDLAEGQPTLPLIRSLETANQDQRQLLRQAITDPGSVGLATVIEIIESGDAITYTARRAQEHADLAKQALAKFPETDAKTSMLKLADFAVSRAF